MDQSYADFGLNEVLCRAGDFVGGIDNEALDFSQLEAFINSDGSQSHSNYFNESLNASAATGKLLNVIVENKRQHSLPESPPDSSSEHPYSPPEDNNPEVIYTTLTGQSIYKPNPILSLIENPLLVIPANEAIINSSEDLLVVPSSNGAQLADVVGGLLEKTLPNADFDKGLVHLTYPALAAEVAPILGQICPETNLVYTNLQNAPKKRKLSQDMIVKSEPEISAANSQLSPPLENLNGSIIDDDYPASESCLSDSQYQCIRFQPFQQQAWHILCDQNLTELAIPHYRVDADKGFNFSNADDAFVCQKKNHFQVTCHVQVLGDAQFVKTADGFQKITSFHLHFYGVKHDCPTQTIRVEQSQSDRSKRPFNPVLLELENSQVTKITIGRLHFSETTSNNMRKKGKPNPEQRYFQLVVGMHAHTSHGNFPIISHASQKIIVRASNPGQFESDVELCWQKGQTHESIFHSGKVGINTDRPDESLVVHGNLKITGHIIQPSDIRAKKNIVECDTAQQLKNVQKIRVVRYEYDPDFASKLNRSAEYSDTGVIAQEVAEILPEAVSPAGNLILGNGVSIENFLVVNKERIFMENIGAVKELCKVTDNLETRIGQLEKMNQRLGNIQRKSVNSSKYGKCSKFNECSNDGDDLCSNKCIQVVIILLVLIMAICLGTLTTLYLMEASKQSQLTQASLQTIYDTAARPPTNQTHAMNGPDTAHSWPNLQPQATLPFRESVRKTALHALYKTSNLIIGRPAACDAIYEELVQHANNNCRVYCCVSPKLDLFSGSQHARNKTADLLNIDTNKIGHSNNIDKQRQKRDNLYFPDRDNNYDAIDDLHFTILIQGKQFNTTLSDSYFTQTNAHNYSFIVPISKHMPDDYINLIFQSSHAHLKDIEHCHNNFEQMQCPGFEENATHASAHKINENSPSQQINSHSVTFEVDLIGFQAKVMTYRASLKQNQNKCKLSSTKLGIEFTEYNFHLYRHCDE